MREANTPPTAFHIKWILVSPPARGRSRSPQIARFWGQVLQTSPCGNGLNQGADNSISSKWITYPPTHWNAYERIKVVQLRSNLLPTIGTVYNRGEADKCMGGCQRNETLCHVLQAYPVTHWERCRRHNYICDQLAKEVEKKHYTVYCESSIWTSDGQRRKPDIVHQGRRNHNYRRSNRVGSVVYSSFAQLVVA